MPHVLVLAAHPDLRASRVNRQLLEVARTLAAAGTQPIEVRDLYALYPDFALDVEAEQAAAARADLIVWQHPIQWCTMPALMKLWLDEVLAYGWAYGRDGTALRGKELWPVLSVGHREQAERAGGFDVFLPPYEQTALLCGMRLRPPLVLHGAQAADAASVAAHARRYAALLGSYPDWPGGEGHDPEGPRELPAAGRPVPGQED